MKRCVHCDFVYEDDQSRCDMDGRELIYEPTLHPFAASAATESTGHHAKSHWRHFAVLPLALVIFGAGLVYYTSRGAATQTTTHSSEKIISSPGSAPKPLLAPAATEPAPSPSHSPESDESSLLEEPKAKPTSSNSASLEPSPEGVRSPAPPRSARKAPGKANHKTAAKVRSFLKKTGRMLKKPFKR